MKTDFFITCHHSDKLAAQWNAAVLKEVPFSIFMESWDFLPGQHPIEKIEHMSAISRCGKDCRQAKNYAHFERES